MKLLIVDDDAELCAMLEEFFEEVLDSDIFAATTASDALALLEDEQPDGMLLDVNLRSRISGFDILSRARAVSPSTKVVMMTSSRDLGSIKKAHQLGAVDCVTKPFTLDYLEDTVQTKVAQLLEYA